MESMQSFSPFFSLANGASNRLPADAAHVPRRTSRDAGGPAIKYNHATDVPAALDLIHAILENVAHFTLCPSELRRRCYAQRLILSHGSSACPSELNQTS